MIKKKNYIFFILLSCFVLSTAFVNAESLNVLNGPNADVDLEYWITAGDTVVEEVDGDPCFVIRDGGYFAQEIVLSDNTDGQFAVLTGLVSSKRSNTTGTITGMPYIYGYMMEAEDLDNGATAPIHTFLQVLDDRYDIKSDSDWLPISGIFPVPEDTGRIMVFLKQAKQRGIAYNNSESRFDDIGVYLFSSAEEARAFVDEYHYQ
jgi:hypothetical protein